MKQIVMSAALLLGVAYTTSAFADVELGVDKDGYKWVLNSSEADKHLSDKADNVTAKKKSTDRGGEINTIFTKSDLKTAIANHNIKPRGQGKKGMNDEKWEVSGLNGVSAKKKDGGYVCSKTTKIVMTGKTDHDKKQFLVQHMSGGTLSNTGCCVPGTAPNTCAP